MEVLVVGRAIIIMEEGQLASIKGEGEEDLMERESR
jgi:hypothetical protein